jgi:hypothetical protein
VIVHTRWRAVEPLAPLANQSVLLTKVQDEPGQFSRTQALRTSAGSIRVSLVERPSFCWP